MKLIHLSDVHYCKEHKEEALASLRAVKETSKKNAVDLIVIAGDIFDSAMLNSANTGFPELLNAIKELADEAPIAMIYGTPSHDVDNSLDVFPKLATKHDITILEPCQVYFLNNHSDAYFVETAFSQAMSEAVLFGVPEPRKKYLLAGEAAGKDETEEAIRNAMRKMCFLLAAKRREYPDIPCVTLYHGEVAGTSYQNDQTIERGTGISITIDDLADIGADYYALGHIHKPQRVGNLPAYYAGSIYPKNFGETHQAGFNIVELTNVDSYGFNADVKRTDFPHPQNLKIETANPTSYETPAVAIAGKRVWVEITCSKEQKAFINVETELARLRKLGAVEGSRVTICDIPVETVRAAEITAVAAPSKKFEVWAKNSDVDYAESCIKKIDALAGEVGAGVGKASGDWELASLRLRGAVGIKKGIHRDEITVNFDAYASGLIALVGANGKGKTTLIENCHPYPQLLTRKGKLQDHFCLRDSFREVVYRNRLDGTMRRFLIQIDGQNKSGSCKYFIFKQSGGQTGMEWEALPGVDGNLKPYEEVIDATFGSIELLLHTAFISQRPTKNFPDLTDATAGEKKSLFVSLAGIDYLQEFSDIATEKGKLEATKIHDAEIKMRMLQGAIDKKVSEEQSLQYSETGLAGYKAKLDEVMKLDKAAKVDVDRLQAEWNAEQIRRRREDDIKVAVDAASVEIENLLREADALISAAENKPRYEKDIVEYEAQQKVIDAEGKKKQKVTEDNLKKQQDYIKVKAVYDEKLKAVEAKRDTLRGRRNVVERLIIDAENNIKLTEREEEVERTRLRKPLDDRKIKIERRILSAKNRIALYERDATDIIEDCPTCGQKLPEDKLAELQRKRAEYIQKISAENTAIEIFNTEFADIANKVRETVERAAALRNAKIDKEQTEIQKLNDDIVELNKRIDELDQHMAELSFDEPEGPKFDLFDDITLKAAVTKRQRIDIAQTRAVLAKAQEAAVRIDGLKKQVVEKTGILREKEMEYAKVKQNPEAGNEIHADLDTAEARYKELSEQYTIVRTEIARTEADIEAVKKSLMEIEEKEKEYTVLNGDSRSAVAESTEWELISKAFGKDGIQALELDALAPGISETANRILASAYGDRFHIEIRTTRIGGAGKKMKQIEDFLIYVIDSEDGEAVLLDDKSGGEAVWIKRAIYDAFAVIRKRNTNFAFLTCFQDEMDGALDGAAKTAYCRMLEAAHAESKLRHTIIITHSNEVKAMIEQKIEIEELEEAE
jgi:exonuclease SbcC